MPTAYVLLRCIGKAVAKNVVNLFTFGVGGDILVDAWDYWQAATREEERPVQVAAVAQLSATELREEVARVVREEAAALPPEQQAQVAAYLEQLPATVRRSLRRPSDPDGRTTVAGAAFRKPEDLLPLLPAGLPRFKVGDRPLPGVDWELEELLGVGGFGEVWKARNPHFDGVAPVALKFCLDPSAKERLLKHEAKIINQVMQQGRHDGIVPLLHTYLSADPPCLAYEYISGGDLTGLIQGRPGGLSARQSAPIIQRLAKIVGFAHGKNPPIVHRDLKPANILVKPRPSGVLLRITDFGIGGLAIQQAVAQSRRGSRNGEFLTAAVRGSYTPLYTSPQQMRGNDPDPRDDVFALGVIWYQLLTGDLTAGRPGGEAWKRRLAPKDVTPSQLSLLASCFEDRREDRPDNGVDLAEKLSQALAPPATAAPTAPYPMAIPLPDVVAAETRKQAPASRPEPRRAPERALIVPAVAQPMTVPQGAGKERLCLWGGLLLGLLFLVRAAFTGFRKLDYLPGDLGGPAFFLPLIVGLSLIETLLFLAITTQRRRSGISHRWLLGGGFLLGSVLPAAIFVGARVSPETENIYPRDGSAHIWTIFSVVMESQLVVTLVVFALSSRPHWSGKRRRWLLGGGLLCGIILAAAVLTWAMDSWHEQSAVLSCVLSIIGPSLILTLVALALSSQPQGARKGRRWLWTTGFLLGGVLAVVGFGLVWLDAREDMEPVVLYLGLVSVMVGLQMMLTQAVVDLWPEADVATARTP